MKENIYEDLTAILMQELFENGLFDINEIASKYTMTDKCKDCLLAIYNEYYSD